MASVVQRMEKSRLSLHGLGVICGLTAGVWLGAAEAPTKLVNSGFSPFAISLCMVRRVNAREKFRMKESLRQCIRPLGGEFSPGLDEIRRVPVL
jgi:hypothetical protein